MATNINALRMRRVLSQHYGQRWSVPTEFGPDGWSIQLGQPAVRHVLVTCSPPLSDGAQWLHASMSGATLPTYEELTFLRDAIFADGYSYQVFAPPAEHVNIHANALHLWGRLDGQSVLPRFGALGTI